jgi:hypothetical protein
MGIGLAVVQWCKTACEQLRHRREYCVAELEETGNALDGSVYFL